MSKSNGKTSEVLDACLSSESPEVKAKVYQIINTSGLEPDDPMFLILALTGQMRVFLETAPRELSKLLKEWKESNSRSLEQIFQAISLIEEKQQQQADTIKKNLEIVNSQCVSELKKAGMAATSAIADANSETIAQARQACDHANELKEEVMALRTSVETDRKTNENVLEALLKRVGQTTHNLERAIAQINYSHIALTRLKEDTIWVKLADWFSPLLALFLIGGVGFILGFWMMALRYNNSINQYEHNIIKWNRDRIVKCNRDRNPKCTLWIVPPEQRE